MKCNLTGGGTLPTAGGVPIRYTAVFCMPGSPLYHSHHIPRVMVSGSSRISRWVGLWCEHQECYTSRSEYRLDIHQNPQRHWVDCELSWRRFIIPWESYSFTSMAVVWLVQDPPEECYLKFAILVMGPFLSWSPLLFFLYIKVYQMNSCWLKEWQ